MGEGKRVRKYVDLDLRVECNPGGAGYRVQAWLPSGAVATHVFSNPFPEGQLEHLRAAASGEGTRDLKVHTAGTVHLDELGKRLYNAVFNGDVRGFLSSSRATLQPDQGLRLRLHTYAEVAEWPWEVLHDHGGFLALSERVSVVRVPDVPNVEPTFRGPRPLRILVVISNPEGTEKLSVEREWDEIRKALSWWKTKGRVQVEKLDAPTLPALLNALKERHYHALHFIGHGTFDVAQGMGMLLFENEQRGAVAINGVALAGVLGGHPSMRLVVLNACEGARTEGFSGVAQKLLLAGIPAVVAMRYPIADQAAVAFTQNFYKAMARERPVDRAVARARESMFALADGRGIDWAVPVLFLKSPDGRLFDWTWPWRLIWGSLAVLTMTALLGVLLSWQAPAGEVSSAPSPRLCPSPGTLPDMQMIYVPAGKFLMGSRGNEDDEQPVHEVTISKPFCVGEFEVTQKQFREVTGENPVNSKIQGDDLPVSSVNWYQAQDFIRKLNEQEEGSDYRLLTEAEWEYIARSSGGDSNCLRERSGQAEPAGSLQPNSLGVRGMFGNVWEWVGDWKGDYPQGPVTDPKGPETGTEKVKRGGAFKSSPSTYCRATARNSQDPDRNSYDVGFRILREIR